MIIGVYPSLITLGCVVVLMHGIDSLDAKPLACILPSVTQVVVSAGDGKFPADSIQKKRDHCRA